RTRAAPEAGGRVRGGRWPPLRDRGSGCPGAATPGSRGPEALAGSAAAGHRAARQAHPSRHRPSPRARRPIARGLDLGLSLLRVGRVDLRAHPSLVGVGLEVVEIPGDEFLLLGGNLVLGIDRRDRAGVDAGAAVDALVRVDVEHAVLGSAVDDAVDWTD